MSVRAYPSLGGPCPIPSDSTILLQSDPETWGDLQAVVYHFPAYGTLSARCVPDRNGGLPEPQHILLYPSFQRNYRPLALSICHSVPRRVRPAPVVRSQSDRRRGRAARWFYRPEPPASPFQAQPGCHPGLPARRDGEKVSQRIRIYNIRNGIYKTAAAQKSTLIYER